MQNPQNTEELKAQIVLACQRLYSRGLVANHDGNITFKLSSDRFLATPTSFSKADVRISDILTLDHGGKVIAGAHKVFSEISWHLSVYRARPDISCIIHGHPPTAGGYGLSGKELGVPALPEAIVSLGSPILNTKFISPLDPDLGKSDGALDLEFKRVLNNADAFIVPGNGAWAVGQQVMQTYYRLELIEQVAQQHFVAESLGQLHRLPEALVIELLKKRPARTLPAPTLSPKSHPPSTGHIDKRFLADIVRDELQGLLEDPQ